jgi:hypothetical protein
LIPEGETRVKWQDLFGQKTIRIRESDYQISPGFCEDQHAEIEIDVDHNTVRELCKFVGCVNANYLFGVFPVRRGLVLLSGVDFKARFLVRKSIGWNCFDPGIKPFRKGDTRRLFVNVIDSRGEPAFPFVDFNTIATGEAE